jgi:DNA polymerase-3 subunit epsilon
VSRVASRVSKFIAGTVLVEHSADAFDTRLISRVIGHQLDLDNLDTSHLAAKLWDLKDTIGLERLCNELGVVNRAPHRALGDAEATAQCFLELVRRGQDQFGWKTLADLLEVGSPLPPRPKKPRPRPHFTNPSNQST